MELIFMMISFFLLFFLFSLSSFFLLLMFLKLNIMFFFEWEFFYMNTISMEFVIFMDWMSFMFLSVVFFISSMVCLYSIEYMTNKFNQFIYLIFFFVISMMMFIISPNMMSMMIGWDGLGLISYVLIIFFQSDKSKNSGMLTVMLNRIGDVLIIFSSWYFIKTGSLNFFFYENFFLKTSFFIIILASMTKSAQMPFSSWLPAAMAAPTPVSSLVHSSTLVTAGIYLLIRFNNYFFYSTNMMNFIMFFGSVTMFLSGIMANYEFDLKKIIALSTLSQLGLMMMILPMNFIMSFFHLCTHALFKALLFLCAGIIIHNSKNNQDIRYLGMMMNYLPLTIMCFNMANLSLCGMPFLSGFFSKDLIIENFLVVNKNFLVMLFLMLSTSLTVMYTFRLMYFLSLLKKNFFLFKMKENKLFNFILMFMTLFSILSGSIFNWILFNIFLEPKLNNFHKIIIPMILLFGITLFLMMKMKSKFISSMMFLNFLLSSFKVVPYFITKGMFFSTNMGYFEFFGSMGLNYLMLEMTKLNNMMLMNFKKVTFFSIMIFFNL